MRITVLMVLVMLLSNCAAIQVVSGSSIQARDVISSINTAHNLSKYSEPAAREELENRVKRMVRSIEAGGETQ
jgi:hypothetical protein